MKPKTPPVYKSLSDLIQKKQGPHTPLFNDLMNQDLSIAKKARSRLYAILKKISNKRAVEIAGFQQKDPVKFSATAREYGLSSQELDIVIDLCSLRVQGLLDSLVHD